MEDVKRRDEVSFWQNRVNEKKHYKINKKTLDYYVFGVLNYGCESWIYSKAMCKKENAFNSSARDKFL